MEKLLRVEGVAVPLPTANISTDAIIPSVWAIKPGVDLGAKLFANERYTADGSENTEFILNRAPYRRARILVTGANFGCGSSREAAVWALQRFGIRCIIAPSFGEIFHDNLFKNGLLPVRLNEARTRALIDAISLDPVLRVDLQTCRIRHARLPDQEFSLTEARRHALLEGLDDLQRVRRAENHIRQFEAKDRSDRPWIWSR